METILKTAGALLGLVIPILFAMNLNRGIAHSAFETEKKLRYTRTVIWVTVISTVMVWILSLARILDYHEGDHIPRFAIPLIAFVGLGLYLLKNRDFQTILAAMSLSSLVGVQVFRFAGTAFLIIADLRMLPQAFQWAGYGDILTGTLALFASIALVKQSANARLLFWLFNFVGLLDLLNVAFLLLLYYPAWSHNVPTSESATQFSLVMIPALVAPIAMLLHIYAIFNAANVKNRKLSFL